MTSGSGYNLKLIINNCKKKKMEALSDPIFAWA